MRLIDADELKRKMEDLVFYRGNIVIEIIDALHKVDECQTVDAEPVKHAHWIPDERETGEGSNTYKCSACGEIQMIIEGTPKENGWKYCPNCGAVMDGEIERGLSRNE